MATAAQIAANQANSRRSTGPRTAEGKAASSRNSTSHGLSSQDFVVLEGQEQEFEEFMAELRAAIQPVGAIELELFAQHAHAAWGLRRCRRAEVTSQWDDRCKGGDPLLFFDMTTRLQRIDVYTRRAERTYQRTLKQLQALQTTRLSAEVVDPIEAAMQPPVPLPALVNPIHLNRQRAAVARSQAASDKACDRAICSATELDFHNGYSQLLAAEMNNQTQSAAQRDLQQPPVSEARQEEAMAA
ncbi:MAG TPA: hypothetical protein VGK29_13520 [Paludibaculum sp.]|jgi:hypothetical protein